MNQFSYEGSDLGVELQGGIEVIKCSSCAEWVKLEAIVCRFCGKDISEITKVIQSELKKRRAEIFQIQAERDRMQALKKDNHRILVLKFLRNFKISIPLALLLVSILTVSSFNLMQRAKLTNIPEKVSMNVPYATALWKKYLDECGVEYYVYNSTDTEKYHLDIVLLGTNGQSLAWGQDFYWTSSYADKINCFTRKSVGFSISRRVEVDGSVDQVVDNAIEIYLSSIGTPSLVFRSL